MKNKINLLFILFFMFMIFMIYMIYKLSLSSFKSSGKIIYSTNFKPSGELLVFIVILKRIKDIKIILNIFE